MKNMLTRRKRLGIDSSPKSPISKSCQLVPKEALAHSLNFCSTPVRRARRSNSTGATNSFGEDSPILSQEPVAVTWKWTSESSPIRSPVANRARGRKHQKSKLSTFNNNMYWTKLRGDSLAPSRPEVPSTETSSPKGLFKFQEEMRKIQINDDQSTSSAYVDNNTYFMDNKRHVDFGTDDNAMDKDIETNIMDTSQSNAFIAASKRAIAVGSSHSEPIQTKNKSTVAFELNDSLEDDLFNDSEFDQVLVTCTDNVEKNKMLEKQNEKAEEQEKVKETAKLMQDVNEMDKSSKSMSETAKANTSHWSSFFNDESIDDILADMDENFINNSKLVRHKSMPQPLPEKSGPSTSTSSKPNHSPFAKLGQSSSSTHSVRSSTMATTMSSRTAATSTRTTATAHESSTKVTTANTSALSSRKCITRHESMPSTVAAIKRNKN